MNTLQLETTATSNIIEQINAKLRGSLTKIDGEYNLVLDTSEAIGTIVYMNLKNGISYLEYDIVFQQDFQLAHEAIHDSPIYFTYAREAELEHSFSTDGTKRRISKFQTGILRSLTGIDNIFYLTKGRNYKFSMIIAHHQIGKIANKNDNSLIEELGAIFKSEQIDMNFTYIGSYNVKIAEKIKQLNAVPYEGVVGTLLKESIVNMILALEIQQHSDDVKRIGCHTGSLNQREMELVQDLSEFIQNYPEREYTIKSLCARSGLSSAKLQEGFRVIHGQTVTHYIRDVRILVAEHLIKTTDLNISEIVYTIGLTSRSYFSKIFKKKYQCSPKTYQENQDATAMAV